MSSTTVSLPLPVVSDEVQVFADRQGVTPYLPAVLEMTRRIFPTAPMTVLLEEDPEIANDWHIVFEVDTVGMTEERLVACRRQWIREIFQHCPATHVCVFRLGLV
jgi:hypothetical protein